MCRRSIGRWWRSITRLWHVERRRRSDSRVRTVLAMQRLSTKFAAEHALCFTRDRGGRALQLLLFFRERLGLAFAPLGNLGEFEAAGVRYRDTGAGFLTTTYDRFRDSAG